MRCSTLLTAVLGLLFCCLGVKSQYQPVVDPVLTELGTKVTESLNERLLVKLDAANNTLIAKGPAVSKCLKSIESEQLGCVSCVNSSCQLRVEALGCTDVKQTPQKSGCAVKAICDVVIVASKAKAGVIVAADAIEKIGRDAVDSIKKVSNEVIKTIDTGLKDAANAIKGVAGNVATGVKKTVNQVGSAIEGAVNTVGKEIAKGVNTAVNAVGEVIEDGVKIIKDILGGRKRRAMKEPVCDDFSKDELACLYYESQCPSCSHFNSTITEDVVRSVCKASGLKDYQDVAEAADSLDPIIELATNFSLIGVKFNPGSWEISGHADVIVHYGMVIGDHTFALTQVVNVWVPAFAAPVIADDVIAIELP